MAKRIVLGVLGVVIGMIAGSILMMLLHQATTLLYPMPEGLDMASTDPADRARVAEWIGTLPTGAFLLTVVAHGLGCMGGAAVAMLIAGRRSLVPAIAVGVLFTAGGIANLMAIPHPAWFPFVDLPIYLVLAIAAGLLLRRRPDAPAEAATGAD